jgi:hypothetical protein
MWGISGRLNDTRQVPAPRAFVSDQTGLMEERGDACDLGHLCCFASRTQQGSSGALIRHRLLHFRFVYSVNFPTQLLGIGCERLRASGHAREGAANAALGPRRDGGRASGGVHQKAVVRLTVQADASGAYQGESDRHGEPKICPEFRSGQPRGVRPGSPAPISIAVAHLPLRASGSDE